MSDERIWQDADERERLWGPGGGTTVLDRPGIDERIDDGSGTGLSGWFCVKVKPFICGGCGRSCRYYDDEAHRIVVWPTENDPNLVRVVESLSEDAGTDRRSSSSRSRWAIPSRTTRTARLDLAHDVCYAPGVLL